MSEKKLMKNYKRHLSYIFLIIFLYAFFSYTQKNIELFNQIFPIQIYKILIIFLISFINYFIKAKINIDIYSFFKIKLSASESLKIILRSTAINLSGPANFGAGYKIHYLKKKYDLNIIENISINTAYTFYLNYFYLVIIFFITLFTIPNQDKNYVYINLFLFFVISILSIFVKLVTSNNIKNIKFKTLKETLDKLLLGFKFFKEDIANASKLFVSSLVYVAITIIYYQIIMSSIGFNISIYSLLVMLCISSIVNLIKLTPGNIGILEVSLIFLQGLHGITSDQIIIFYAFTRIVSFLSIIFLLCLDKITTKS